MQQQPEDDSDRATAPERPRALSERVMMLEARQTKMLNQLKWGTLLLEVLLTGVCVLAVCWWVKC